MHYVAASRIPRQNKVLVLGSHLHLRRAPDGKRVTVPVHQGRTVPVGTLRAILRDADISVDEFRELL